MKYKKSNGAFTLAEVLITLSVIGVVAAMTIPTLFGYINDLELRAGFRRNYSDLTATTLMIKKDYDGSLIGNITSLTDLRDKYAKYYKIIQSCNNSSADGCWHKANEWKEMDGTQNAAVTDPGLVLNNGVLLVFENYFSSNCDSTGGTTSAHTTLTNVCGDIMIDVNGSKKPNTIGRDIFYAWILSNSIRAWGSDSDIGDSSSSTCTPTGGGWGCAHFLVTGKDNYVANGTH